MKSGTIAFHAEGDIHLSVQRGDVSTWIEIRDRKTIISDLSIHIPARSYARALEAVEAFNNVMSGYGRQADAN